MRSIMLRLAIAMAKHTAIVFMSHFAVVLVSDSAVPLYSWQKMAVRHLIRIFQDSWLITCLSMPHWKYAYSNGFNSTKNTVGSFTLLYLYQRKKRHMWVLVYASFSTVVKYWLCISHFVTMLHVRVHSISFSLKSLRLRWLQVVLQGLHLVNLSRYKTP